jgi:hypothetical protein
LILAKDGKWESHMHHMVDNARQELKQELRLDHGTGVGSALQHHQQRLEKQQQQLLINSS